MRITGLGLLARARRLAFDRRANFAVMTALCTPFAVALTAVAVDQGSLFTERREAQALTDLAAITAAANIDKAEAAVLTTMADNGLSGVRVQASGQAAPPTNQAAVVEIVRGRYAADPSVSAGNRFEPGGRPFNAVQVSLRKLGTLYFGSALMPQPVIGTSAIATTSAQATFSIGSRLAKVDGGLLNALLSGLLGAIDAAPNARTWAAALVRYELLLLAELGFGLDLSECAATGSETDLAWVSPKSGRAVSEGAAEGYRDRLFRLPPFLVAGGGAEWDDIFDGLRITGHFLARDLLIGRQSEVLASRERLVDRLRRVMG